ncbi:MAG: tRNA (N(6)-L-threonylcarbamoyladenosine(37)-C(2))-methylthiotransferase MtaB [Candidatus Krumholzibacteriia bacterium]
MPSRPPAPRPVRVAFTTLGCRLNQFDTEAMKAALPDGDPAAGGLPWVGVAWEDEADVYVINSCTVTGKADQKCRQLARAVKRRRPEARVVVAGCYAQTQPQRVAAIAGVDGVVGNTLKEAPARWLPAVLAAAAGPPVVRVDPFPRRLPFAAAPLERFAGHSRAFVKIQDGCDLRCAYCLVWQARGPARSRPADDIVAQAAALEAAGFRELVLSGVNLGSYGRERGGTDALAALVERLLAARPNLRLRLGSLHPDEVTPALLRLWAAASPRLRPHLHVSLQSGDDDVLARMRRPYRAAAAAEAALAFAAAAGPHAALGADVIAGFPGETDAAHARTVALLAGLPLTYLHVFRFSPRPGTPAADLPAPVPPETATARAGELRRLGRRRGREFAAALAGTWREAIVEDGEAPAGWRPATTDNYATVLVPDHWAAGALVRLRVGRPGAAAPSAPPRAADVAAAPPEEQP